MKDRWMTLDVQVRKEEQRLTLRAIGIPFGWNDSDILSVKSSFIPNYQFDSIPFP
jgi:hypothetical protein